MGSLLGWAFDQPLASGVLLAFIAWLSYITQAAVYNSFFHPLSSFPGPRIAATTTLWKAFVECILNRSFCHVLEELHAQYGVYTLIVLFKVEQPSCLVEFGTQTELF